MDVPVSPITVDVVNGARLAFQVFGHDDLPTIVLVPGAASAMEWWDDDFCLLLAASGRRVIRYDLRDTGQSETVPPGAGGYTGADLLDDLAALIVHTRSAPAHLVGLSAGGGMAQNLALQRPELLATLTLMSTSPVGSVAVPLPPPTAELSASFAAVPPQTDWDDPEAVGDLALAAERLYSGSLPVDEMRICRIAVGAASRSPSPDSAANHWSVADPPSVRTDIETIALPTLVIHGSEDPLFPLAHGKALAGLLPGARLVVVPGMGHQFPPPPTWPQIVGELLRHTS